MKNLILAVGLALLIFAMVVLTTPSQNTLQVTQIAEIYIFGDSLSDTGTVFRATGGLYPPNPPYFQGRYSNGRLWVEYLADRLQLSYDPTNNFACGGATTGAVRDRPSDVSDDNSFVLGLLAQVQSFTQTHPQNDANALYIVWAGANDYLQGASSATAPVENVTNAIATLADTGAKKFLVGNLPDLGQLPATQTSTNSASLSALTQAHNRDLRRSLKQLSQQRSDLQMVTLNVDMLYREAIANPTEYGFTNVINGCLSGSRPCSNPNQFLFWDDIHPTTATHQRLGDAAFVAIQGG